MATHKCELKHHFEQRSKYGIFFLHFTYFLLIPFLRPFLLSCPLYSLPKILNGRSSSLLYLFRNRRSNEQLGGARYRLIMEFTISFFIIRKAIDFRSFIVMPERSSMNTTVVFHSVSYLSHCLTFCYQKNTFKFIIHLH